MNTIQRPPVEATNGDGSSDHYEELLRAFFRAEMPNPWPVFERPVLAIARPHARTSRFARLKSRAALAASVALLLLGTWLLAGAFRSGPGSNSSTDANDTAKKKVIYPPMVVPEKSK
jgi:hypothetical protein